MISASSTRACASRRRRQSAALPAPTTMGSYLGASPSSVVWRGRGQVSVRRPLICYRPSSAKCFARSAVRASGDSVPVGGGVGQGPPVAEYRALHACGRDRNAPVFGELAWPPGRRLGVGAGPARGRASTRGSWSHAAPGLLTRVVLG